MILGHISVTNSQVKCGSQYISIYSRQLEVDHPKNIKCKLLKSSTRLTLAIFLWGHTQGREAELLRKIVQVVLQWTGYSATKVDVKKDIEYIDIEAAEI